MSGAYDVLGFFNTIKNMSALNQPANASAPKLPSSNFVMKIKIYEPCVLPDQPDMDRCVYYPPKSTSSNGAYGISPPPPAPVTQSPPMPPPTPPSPPSPPPSPAPPPTASPPPPVTGRRRQLMGASSSGSGSVADPAATVEATAAEGATPSGPLRRRNLRHRYVATAAPLFPEGPGTHKRRSLPGVETSDLAGVELIDGVRYMTHNETTYLFNGSVRVAYDFAIYPGFQRIEVSPSATSNLTMAWQRDRFPDRSTSLSQSYFCRNYTAASSPATLSAGQVVNFTYMGVDHVGDRRVGHTVEGGGRLARHFELFVLQPSRANPNKTETVRIDYWDTQDTNAPLRFKFQQPDVGSLYIDVLEFRSINASSPEAAPGLYKQPPITDCISTPRIPRLTSPFAVRGAVMSASAGGMVSGADAPTARRMLQQSAERAAEWAVLDHVNGTGEWPQWALDMYGGVHPATLAERRRLQQQEGGSSSGVVLPTSGHIGGPRGGRRMLGDCGTKVTGGIGIPPCTVGWWFYSQGFFGLSVGCGGDLGPIALEGELSLDTCGAVIQGCLAIGVGLPDTNWLVKKASYDFDEHFFFISASLFLDLIVFEAELSFEMDFSSCCIWIPAVSLEASVGIDAGFITMMVTIGSIDIVTDVYLKGSPDTQDDTENPTANNQVGGWTSVGDGYWGDWQSIVYPCSKYYYDSGSGSMKLVALPMNSYMLRVEGDQGWWTDDTALNGISVGCVNGQATLVEDGIWGSWSSSVSCQPGGYFVGAKMRIEGPQGSEDDTAANSLVFTCSNSKGTDLVANGGIWGDWGSYTYCPANSYICGLQVRFEPDDSSDDTALNGVRIACCTFPTDNATYAVSSTAVQTGTNAGKNCLDIPSNNQVSGTLIQQWGCNNSTAQLLKLTSTVTGAYTITAIPSGLCLTVQNAATSNGARIQLAACTSAANQMWAIRPYGAGTYTIMPTHTTGMCLDISGSSASFGAVVQIWNCNLTPAQVYTLNLPTRSTTTTILTSTTTNSTCLDISNDNQNPGTYVQQWTCNGSPAQLFTVTTAGA
ncbi:hypothetical protein GPECTOR_172g198 [Gonium pectorale]|uniref:Ricin B lectin domain-containing protein n=1 Tax=Gonium pectorale TaxID=33097 RepID=A0A150FXB9_GONPE|nr:hypothetical protein GPECTOR_172g198 [Gonium pectorale]|eukprot:KXZ42261.1 hypothetical protein GPECTOR_172g198 [Gonium pectorale]